MQTSLPADADPASHHTRLHPALLVSALLLAIYLLTFNALPVSDDEQLFLVLSQSLAERGQFTAEPLYGNARIAGSSLSVEPLLPLLGALVYRLLPLLPTGNVTGLMLINLYLGALTGGLLTWLARRLSAPPLAAAFLGLGYGLGTLAWPYALTFYRDPTAAFFVTLALVGLAETFTPPRRTVLGPALAGPALALLGLTAAALTKLSALLIVPPLLLLYLLHTVHQPPHRRQLVAVILGVPVAIALLYFSLGALTGQYRFTLAYLRDLLTLLDLRPTLFRDLIAALFSPGKGLLLYSPAVLLTLAAPFTPTFRQRWPLWVAALAHLFLTLTLQILLYPDVWWTVSWGTRFLLPVLPGLLLAALPTLDWLSTRPRLALAMLALTTLPPALGALIPWQVYNYALFFPNQFTPAGALPLGLTDPAQSQFAAHFTALINVVQGQGALAVLWTRLDPLPAIVLLLLTAGVIVAAVFGLTRRLPHPVTLTTLALVLLLPLFTARALRADPAFYGDRPDLQAAIAALNARPADNLRIIPSYLSPPWQAMLNASHGPAVWVSLPPNPTAEMTPATRALLSRVYLADSGCLLIDRSLPDQEQHHLTAYLTPLADLTPTRFSDSLTLLCYTIRPPVRGPYDVFLPFVAR